MAETLSLSDRSFAELLGMSKSTFDRRRQEGRLDADESERVYRAARLVAEALLVFEVVGKAAKWFGEPNRALDRHRPLACWRPKSDQGKSKISSVGYCTVATASASS